MTKIKLCGLFRLADIDAANAASPDYVGFVFAPSKRRIDAIQADVFRRRLRGDIPAVGVFVDAEIARIAALYQNGIIQMAQLHGGESDDYLQELKSLCGIPIIRTVRMGINRQNHNCGCADYLLLDSGAGTGKTFCWSDIKTPSVPWFLAGGISMENISEALRQGAYAVDVSSGIETNGRKDPQKMLAIVQSARSPYR
ncbi:MAG: phosphoribosylanthranilate isomerase [Oscillospiraceae bacterium]|nr:phosphoribosylanthranilate isomerase [Oscillospiraceae bacterium]